MTSQKNSTLVTRVTQRHVLENGVWKKMEDLVEQILVEDSDLEDLEMEENPEEVQAVRETLVKASVEQTRLQFQHLATR